MDMDEDDPPPTESENDVLRYARFKPQFHRRRPGETDAQYAACRRATKYHARMESFYLALFQMLCTHRGFDRDCGRHICRRLKRCTGRRGQLDWSVVFKPYVPPCVPLYEDLVEEMRAEIRAELTREKARQEAKAAEAG